jgi:hypothetical protein
MINVVLEAHLPDGTHWRRPTELLAVPRQGEAIAIRDPRRGGAPVPYVVSAVEHRVHAHREGPPEIAVGLNVGATDSELITQGITDTLLDLGFTQSTAPHSPRRSA